MRWICRTPDQDGLGLAFPATAEVEGFTAEKFKGNIVKLDGKKSWSITMRMGLLTAEESGDMKARINRIRQIKIRLAQTESIFRHTPYPCFNGKQAACKAVIRCAFCRSSRNIKE